MDPGAQYFSSLCRQHSRLHEVYSCGLPDWTAERRHRSRWSSSTGLPEVTNHPIVQGAVPNNLIRVCRNEDRRDRVARIDEVSVEFDASHSRHLDVGDQAGGFSQERRSPGNRLPTGTFRQCSPATSRVFSWNCERAGHPRRSRSICGFGIAASGSFSAQLRAPPNASPCKQLPNISEGSRQSNGRAPKRWLMLSAIRLGAVDVDLIVSRLKAIIAGRRRSL